MAFDYKKEYKEFYMPKRKPEIVDVPAMNFIAVRGVGNPNEKDGAYQQRNILLDLGYPPAGVRHKKGVFLGSGRGAAEKENGLFQSRVFDNS